MSAVVLWDFDGTLAHRPGRWSGCLVSVLDQHVPGHAVRPEDVVPLLSTGFPWHSPKVVHPHLCNEEAWWRELEALLARAFANLGFQSRAEELAAAAHALYADPAGFAVFDDVWPALDLLRAAGWRSAILSNHIPELPAIASALGFDGFIDEVVNSAATGFEKPHPKAFELAVAAMGAPERVWMIGDNYDADVAGAAGAGIPAVLVRTEDERADRSAPTALDAVDLILGEQTSL